MSSHARRQEMITIASVACMALFLFATLTTPAAAQSYALAGESAGFDMLGFIQAATIDTPGNLLSGGIIKVNDHVIIVPANSIVQMPAATLSWGQVFAQAPAAVSNLGTATGLALADCLSPVGNGIGCLPGTWEAHVQGNIVASPVCALHNDPTTGLALTSPCYIAGLIFLSQQSLNASQGFIDAIDYASGTLIVNGRPVMINDPKIPGLTNPVVSGNVGRFTIGQTQDARFTVDQGNPTVRSETGYPMCIPRVAPGTAAPHPVVAGSLVTSTEDDRCPQRNRPLCQVDSTTIRFCGSFTMPAARSNPLTTAPDGNPDAWEQIPFEVGDFISYAGVLMPPCAAGTGPGTPNSCLLDMTAPQSKYVIAAYQVIANLGAYTFPGSNPVYVAIDVLLQGTGGIPNPAFPQEVTSKVKVEGFSTDSTRTVDALALDQDCNGILRDRTSSPWVLFLTVDPGPPTGAKKGRFRFRPAGGAFLPPTSLVRARVSDYTGYLSPSTTDPNGVLLASPTIAANGLIYGQYNAPDFEFVFPENLLIGSPQLTYNFQDFPELVNGIGPLNGAPNAPLVGQLSPWPDLTAPATSCTPGVTTGLNANFTVTPDGISSPATVGSLITLDAGASVESGATNLVWSLKGIQCMNFICSLATFTPTSAAKIPITLTATQVVNGVTIGTVTSPTFTLNVTPQHAADTVTITSVVYRISKGRLDVSATSSIVQQAPSNCSVTNVLPGCMKATLDIINISTGQPYAALMQNLGNGTYTVTFTGIPAPNLVTVTSGNGGTAVSGVTRIR